MRRSKADRYWERIWVVQASAAAEG